MAVKSNEKTFFTMRVDKKEKSNLKKLYSDLGLDLSTAVNLFFKQSLADNGLPFQPKRIGLENAQAGKEGGIDHLEQFTSVDEFNR